MQPNAPPSITKPSQEPLAKLIRRYLGIINEVPRKEKRFAILKDLIAVTPNSRSLNGRLAILERDEYISSFEDGKEVRFTKTQKGIRLEQILNEDWELIQHLIENWQGKEKRKYY
jgi:hypothetical protein